VICRGGRLRAIAQQLHGAPSGVCRPYRTNTSRAVYPPQRVVGPILLPVQTTA
jgi:hypothetical protein